MTAAEDVLKAIGKIPVPVVPAKDTNGQGFTLGPGYRPLMEAYEAAQKAVDAERTTSQDSHAS